MSKLIDKITAWWCRRYGHRWTYVMWWTTHYHCPRCGARKVRPGYEEFAR